MNTTHQDVVKVQATTEGIEEYVLRNYKTMHDWDILDELETEFDTTPNRNRLWLLYCSELGCIRSGRTTDIDELPPYETAVVVDGVETVANNWPCSPRHYCEYVLLKHMLRSDNVPISLMRNLQPAYTPHEKLSLRQHEVPCGPKPLKRSYL